MTKKTIFWKIQKKWKIILLYINSKKYIDGTYIILKNKSKIANLVQDFYLNYINIFLGKPIYYRT